MQPLFAAVRTKNYFMCVLWMQNLQPVLMEMVAKGGKNVCYVEPAEIFKTAILANAQGIFCFHNHPAGSTEASQDDINLTARLEVCGVMLGISFVRPYTLSVARETSAA